jgi:hypothetical protein
MTENHNSDPAPCQILLVAEVCIHGDQYIKSSFREAQKFAILLSRPPRFLNGETFVALMYEVFFQRSKARTRQLKLSFKLCD